MLRVTSSPTPSSTLRRGLRSSRSHLASQSGPGPQAESKPEPRLDRQIRVIPMPIRGTGDTGCNGPLFDRLFVCPHQGTPFASKAPLPHRGGGVEVNSWEQSCV